MEKLSFGRKTEYQIGLEKLRLKYPEKNPNFEEIIKSHSRLMAKIYVMVKPENMEKYCPLLKKLKSNHETRGLQG